MTATHPDVWHQPLWVSALLASTTNGVDSRLRHRVRWESGRPALRFSNDGLGSVMIPALGIELSAGSEIDVRWPAGATGYELQLHRAPHLRAA